jgi:drug/metabolite transporter superfamily protein YnfA
MQYIGVATVVLFLAALASFMTMFLYPAWVRTGGIMGVVFLIVAALLLAVTIKRRNKTERI